MNVRDLLLPSLASLLLLVPVYEYVETKQYSTTYVTEPAQVVSTRTARCSYKSRISNSCYFVTVKYAVSPTQTAIYHSKVPIRHAYVEGDAIELDVAVDSRWDVRLREERPFKLAFMGIPSVLALCTFAFALLRPRRPR